MSDDEGAMAEDQLQAWFLFQAARVVAGASDAGASVLAAKSAKIAKSDDDEDESLDEEEFQVFYISKKAFETVRDALSKGGEALTLDMLEDLMNPGNLGNEEIMIPVDPDAFEDFDAVYPVAAAKRLGLEGAAEVWVKARKTIEDMPACVRPHERIAQVWRARLDAHTDAVLQAPDEDEESSDSEEADDESVDLEDRDEEPAEDGKGDGDGCREGAWLLEKARLLETGWLPEGCQKAAELAAGDGEEAVEPDAKKAKTHYLVTTYL